MYKSSDSHPFATGMSAILKTGAGGSPKAGAEIAGPASENIGEEHDAELAALATLAALGSTGPRFLYDAYRGLGKKRSGHDPEGAARAFRRAMATAMAIGAKHAEQTNKWGELTGRKKADLFLVKAARSIWRELAALPLNNNLYGSLDAIRAASRIAPETWPRSLPAQAYALGSVEDECLDLFWRALAGGAAIPIALGEMFVSWSLVRIGAALGDEPQAPAFLYRAFYWNNKLPAEGQLTHMEIARAAADLPQGQREPLLLMTLYPIGQEWHNIRRLDAEREQMERREQEGHRRGQPDFGPSLKYLSARTKATATAVADLDWAASLLLREGVDNGMNAARRLYNADAAGDELCEVMYQRPWGNLSWTQTYRMVRGGPVKGDWSGAAGNNSSEHRQNCAQHLEGRTAWVAKAYQQAVDPATAHQTIATWPGAAGAEATAQT